jgi:hypothetical protein
MANRYSQLPLSVVEKYYPESPFLNELRTQQNIPFANQGIIQNFPSQTFNYDYLQSNPYQFNQFDEDVLREEEDTQYFPEEKNIFQKGLDYLSERRGDIVRGGIGSLLGTAFLGPIGGILGSFLGQGIGNRGALSTFRRSNTLMDFVNTMKNQRAVEAAVQAAGPSGSGGDTFNFSDNSGYGGTGTSSPSNVGPGGRMGGGV